MFTALRAHDFRLLWLSQSISVLGDTLIYVAIGIYVTRLTGDPTDVGLVLAAYSLPFVALLLVGGVLADRLPRQRVMVVTDLVRAGLHGLLAVLIVTGSVRIWHMVAIGVAFGCASAFFRPAYTGLVPQTVAEDAIQSAQAMGGVSREIASALSPALATVLVLGFGGAAAFALDSVSFAASAALLTRVRPRDRGPRVAAESLITELRHGGRAVRERPWVLWTTVSFAVALLVGLAPFQVLGAAVARQVYGTEAVFGWSEAAWGLGSLTGALIGAWWRPHRPLVVGLAGLLPFALVNALYASGPPLAVLYPVMMLSGIGLGLFMVLWETALAQQIPPHLLSRVSAWDWMGAMALLPVGYVAAGPVGALIGDRHLMLTGGLLATLIFVASLLPRSTRELRGGVKPITSGGQTHSNATPDPATCA